jgi:hypothetical protein
MAVVIDCPLSRDHRPRASHDGVFSIWKHGNGVEVANVGGNTPGIGGRLPTQRLMTRNNAMIAAWLVVID